MSVEYAIQAKRWVVKVGSALLTREDGGLNESMLAALAGQIVSLRQAGVEVVLVSSGAVAAGMGRMGWSQKPQALSEKQAAAAIGQMQLVQAYETEFAKQGYATAQVLLTHDDLAHRQRYLNAKNTLRHLLKLGVISVVNENDTVASEGLRLGDNDTLAAMVANLVEAELLVILTDQDGLYDKDPRHHADAQFIEKGVASDPRYLAFAGGVGSQFGSGGMRTKVLAAQRAAQSGCATIIAPGAKSNVLDLLKRGETIGTLLVPDHPPLAARKQWLASQLTVAGTIVLDEGAAIAIEKTGRSLLAIGVSSVTGDFKRGDLVACLNAEGRVLAHGLVNYNSEEAAQLAGKPSSDISSILGYVYAPELIHRDNLVLL